MLSTTIPEPLVRCFKFWSDNEIKEGIYWREELYKLVSTFSPTERERAYALGVDISQHGKSTVITCSQDSYRVWVSLISCESVKQDVTPSFEELSPKLLQEQFTS